MNPPGRTPGSPGGRSRGPRVGQGDPVHYVGIDLAWGEKKPTGVAVIDADARLLHVGAVLGDEEIEAALSAGSRWLRVDQGWVSPSPVRSCAMSTPRSI